MGEVRFGRKTASAQCVLVDRRSGAESVGFGRL